MKKKLLLIISMFLVIFNVKALTFNVDVTNIEDKGSNSLGTITNIDVPGKELDVLFEEVGDEVNFEITVTNTGNRAGTLREINITGTSDKISYTTNLPDNGLAINGNDTNKVTINAKVLEGITKGKTTSTIKLTYKYDEGSCPEGEILSEDESMCLCPEGKVRSDSGICIDPPEDKPTCEEDEVYNETKKICEPVIAPPEDKPSPKPTPNNPKTLDNIVLITLLFIVSGLGIYAVMFKKLKTDKQKKIVGAITGVVTLSLSFTVLAGVFEIENLLGAIVNPITKSKEIVIKVNEEFDPVITWDGDCDITEALTPDNIFQGGSGTEQDPYQIKTANQLACFAKSINEGATYEGQFIKQIKNIKLNDNLVENATKETPDLSNAHLWTSAGDYRLDPAPYFAGTYDGDGYIISGLYVTDESVSAHEYGNYKGLFGYAVNATFKNLELKDVYINATLDSASLLGYGYKSLTVENVKTYGKSFSNNFGNAGIVSNVGGNNEGIISFTNVENNIDITNTSSNSCIAGVVSYIQDVLDSEEPSIIFNNVTNNGNVTSGTFASSGGIGGYIYGKNILITNSSNNGDFTLTSEMTGSQFGGLVGTLYGTKLVLKDSHNTGNISTIKGFAYISGIVGYVSVEDISIDNCYNSGDILATSVANDTTEGFVEGGFPPGTASPYAGGIIAGAYGKLVLTNSFNSGKLVFLNYGSGGLLGSWQGNNQSDIQNSYIENCYNVGEIISGPYVGGIAYSAPAIRKAYNKGKITQYMTNQLGGIAVQASGISNSYNEGDIYITAVTDGGGYAGGVCGYSCGEIRNCYNRGNIVSKNNGIAIGGISGQSGTPINSYNSGDITFLDTTRHESVMIGGIAGQGGTPTNTYNLGNININYNAPSGSKAVSGITTYADAINSVNTGNITVTMGNYSNEQNVRNIYLSGITQNNAKNCFNAGTMSILNADGSPLNPDLINADNERYIKIGEITMYHSSSSTGNKFKNPNGYAVSQVPFSSTVEQSEAVGVYTEEEVPSILSIINGDDAFEIKEGETLPTLKVFNN